MERITAVLERGTKEGAQIEVDVDRQQEVGQNGLGQLSGVAVEGFRDICYLE